MHIHLIYLGHKPYTSSTFPRNRHCDLGICQGICPCGGQVFGRHMHESAGPGERRAGGRGYTSTV